MRINNDCARKFLMETEKIKLGETIPLDEMQKRLKDFSMEDVLNVALILNTEYAVNLVDRKNYDNIQIYESNRVSNLTKRGYEMLDAVRDEETWNMLKEKLPNFDEISFFGISNLMARINTAKLNKLFGIPEDMTNLYY